MAIVTVKLEFTLGLTGRWGEEIALTKHCLFVMKGLMNCQTDGFVFCQMRVISLLQLSLQPEHQSFTLQMRQQHTSCCHIWLHSGLAICICNICGYSHFTVENESSVLRMTVCGHMMY
jgi:hypothetical protein